ncbi:MAG: DUF6677 family protein [Gemmataceae bacterium]
MDHPAAPPPPPDGFPSANDVSPLGGLLSYLVPGLGQIVQGRVAKGLLFFGCIYVLFFYGLYLGAAEVKVNDRVERTYKVTSNVFLPRAEPRPNEGAVSAVLNNLYNRPQFLGQFWAGVVVWPAIAQYAAFDRSKEDGLEGQLDRLYDEAANEGPETEEGKKKLQEAEALEKERRHPLFGEIMREPSMKAINAVHNGSDKRLEVAWVFTVIAGVLNIMVIYDAFAGPAYPAAAEEPKKGA